VPARPPHRRGRHARPPLRGRVAHEARRPGRVLEAEHEAVALVPRAGGARAGRRACRALEPARPAWGRKQGRALLHGLTRATAKKPGNARGGSACGRRRPRPSTRARQSAHTHRHLARECARRGRRISSARMSPGSASMPAPEAAPPSARPGRGVSSPDTCPRDHGAPVRLPFRSRTCMCVGPAACGCILSPACKGVRRKPRRQD